MTDQQHPEAVVRTRRLAVGRALTGVANGLYATHEHHLSLEPEGALNRDFTFLSDKERKALTIVAKNIATCEVNLRKIAKALGVE